MLDLEILLPACLSSEKYRTRFLAFREYGLLNTGRHQIKLIVLTGQDDFSTFQDEGSWPCEINFVSGPYDDAPSKIYHHYASLVPQDSWTARWHLRVDDDSVTDVGGLLNWLDRVFSWREEHYFAANIVADLWSDYERVAREMGLEHVLVPDQNGAGSIVHEGEMALLSQPMIEKIIRDAACRQYLRRCSEVHGAWGDHALAFCAHLVGRVPARICSLSAYPQVEQFSLFGGGFFHIHYVAPDLDVWSRFTELYKEHVPPIR